jgi:hypothetical protein
VGAATAGAAVGASNATDKSPLQSPKQLKEGQGPTSAKSQKRQIRDSNHRGANAGVKVDRFSSTCAIWSLPKSLNWR